MKIDDILLLGFLERMYLIREFEQKLYELAERGLVFGSVHLCIGEEATAVGICSNLKNNDFIIPTHRGHGQEIAKGSDINRMLSEMIGKENGLCKGRVGSMHITDKSVNNLGAQGIIGASFPISIGVGLAIKLKRMESIVVCFFGEGATNQGNFYESLNIAELWELPILFACVNNQYGMGTPYKKTSNILVHNKSKSFNIKTAVIDGNDVEKIYGKCEELINYIKKEKRPALIEMLTYRWLGHSAFDRHAYRPREEINEWKKKDPIHSLEEKLLKNNNAEEIDKIKNKVKSIILDAEKYALSSAYPVFDTNMEY